MNRYSRRTRLRKHLSNLLGGSSAALTTHERIQSREHAFPTSGRAPTAGYILEWARTCST